MFCKPKFSALDPPSNCQTKTTSTNHVKHYCLHLLIRIWSNPEIPIDSHKEEKGRGVEFEGR